VDEQNDLTAEQSMAMDYLGDQSNRVTRDNNGGLWRENLLKNKALFIKGNPDLAGLAVFVVGAGPSLDKNVGDLKLVSERGVILCVDAALRFLLESGVKPEFCMMIDGSEKMVDMVKGCDTEGITLVCTPSACPAVVADWKGPRFFVNTPYVGGDRKHNMFPFTRDVRTTREMKQGEELVLHENYEVNFEGVNTVVSCGGNVSTAAHHFALTHLRGQVAVFVGMDYSWKYESHHYCGHDHADNAKARSGVFGAAPSGTHKDSNGDDVNTNLSLLAFKRWHEQFARQARGSVANATEGGILGIDQKGEKMDCVEFLTLKEAVAKYAPRRA
jgi:hypothetical protein